MTDETHLYQQIAESIRVEILEGHYQSGGRLPSIRELSLRWGCTQGTVQHAYHELARQGLVISHPGQGTRVKKMHFLGNDAPLRKALLVNRTEAFLLDILNSGHSLTDVEQAFGMALDRWRSLPQMSAPPMVDVIHFAGSNDLVIDWLRKHFSEIVPDFNLQVNFCGSLGGLFALAEGKTHLAGSHLWDEESNTYNLSYIRKVLPGKRCAIVTLANRRQGLIVPQGNPMGIYQLGDLALKGVQFINRQPGSGTRVWLDANLRKIGIDTGAISGYTQEKLTHAEVAQVVALGHANAALGLEASALAFGLSFVFLMRERYDLVCLETDFHKPPIARLVDWLKSSSARAIVDSIGGYESDHTGEIAWAE
jgi:molybdate-binding protein/DNA-binding transcriptional regulator YhcF (GntR family)